jgi:hypothetical protein
MSKKKIQEAETEYYCAREKWGENNLETQRTWGKWQNLKAEFMRKELRKKINALIENPRKWWKTQNDGLDGEIPENVLVKNPERLERMIYFLQSGEARKRSS